MIVSERTGEMAIFHLEYVDWGFGANQDVEQDEIAGWNFRSTCGRFRVLIIND